MLNHFFSYCPSLERIYEAPYQEYIRNLAEDLWEKGYNRRVGQIYLRFAAKFWTARAGITADNPARTIQLQRLKRQPPRFLTAEEKSACLRPSRARRGSLRCATG
jgi:site-specific recombinase XerD